MANTTVQKTAEMMISGVADPRFADSGTEKDWGTIVGEGGNSSSETKSLSGKLSKKNNKAKIAVNMSTTIASKPRRA